jgi:serine phosphatase RsbU (regulator of sigma subunit)
MRKEEMYRDERLKQIILASAGLSPAKIKDAILAELQAYRQGRPAEDDVTPVVAKWMMSNKEE